LTAEPHVAMWAKRCFPKIKRAAVGELVIDDSDAVCRDFEWFAKRFELEIPDAEYMAMRSSQHSEKILRLDQILAGTHTAEPFDLAIRLREYQSQATQIYLAQGYLLLGDDVGLGKTACAIASFCDVRTLPAVVVTLAHLPRQWASEIEKFAPNLIVHVLKRGTPYELPKMMGRLPDVLVLNYHKIAGWADVLGSYAKSIVYDEIQELRCGSSQKYQAAKQVAYAVDFALGLSATPIYNYGGEIFNVVEALRPGLLGRRSEFATEWCEGSTEKSRLREPAAFGSFLREQHILLRRTRAEVGRELPKLQRIVQSVDSDTRALSEVDYAARELAEIILSQDKLAGFEKMQAAGEFDQLIRQATGLAKAPYVAAFVEMLVESGERVLLYGWHRAVYDIWLSKLSKYAPAMYTGSESPSKKQTECGRFVERQTPILIMSLRSGAGVDGLQHVCRTVVVGELDWSPGVHEQNIGRVFRDGQADPVVAYFLLATDGADPIMAETLGLKREQIDGLRDLSAGGLERLDRNENGLKRLAATYIAAQARASA
jgi:SNF2 family DNA or RNA helicase